VRKGKKAIELCMPITCTRTIERETENGVWQHAFIDPDHSRSLFARRMKSFKRYDAN